MLLSITLGVPFHEIRNWSSAEIALYRAYWNISPWGEFRADLRNAMSMQLVAEVNRDRKRKPDPYRVQDFMPFHKEPELDTDQLRDKMRRAFKLMK